MDLYCSTHELAICFYDGVLTVAPMTTMLLLAIVLVGSVLHFVTIVFTV